MKRNNITHSTVALITVIAILTVIQFITTGTMNIPTFIVIMLLSTIPYVVITKKFYIIAPFASVFTLMFTLATLPSAIYLSTGDTSSFSISAVLFGYSLALLTGTLTKRGNWGIRNTWVAAGLNSIFIYFFSYALITSGVKNALLVVLLSTTLSLIPTFGYLLSKKAYRVNKPSLVNLVDLKTSLDEYPGLTTTLSKDNKELVIVDKDSKNLNSFRVEVTDSQLFINPSLKSTKQYNYINKKGKEIPIYGWLVKECVYSKEKKRDKGVGKESFVLIYTDKKTKAKSTEVGLKLPRNRTIEFSIINSSLDRNDMTKSLLDLIVDRSLNSD